MPRGKGRERSRSVLTEAERTAPTRLNPAWMRPSRSDGAFSNAYEQLPHGSLYRITQTHYGQGMNEFEIRRAGPGDFDALRFFCDCILRRDYFIRAGQLEEILSGDRHEAWLVGEGIALVAFAILSRGSRLVNVLVHPSWRGMGLGEALVNASGATSVRVKLDMRSGDPEGFYRRIGFGHVIGRNAKGNIVVREKRKGFNRREEVHRRRR